MQTQFRIGFILLVAFVVLGTCGTSYAQSLKSTTPGAGWQTWNVGDLNDNAAPFWDTPWGASQPNDEGNAAEKNVGYCLTSTGDCIGIGSAQFAPGVLPFWGMPYNSTTDTGGGIDPNVFFKGGSSTRLKATLYLNSSANPVEINEFGWFETNSTGSVVGATHTLFLGTGPQENLTPSPVGSTVTFSPTAYFGYYYIDVSEGSCHTYTLVNFNDPNCAGSGNNHNFAVFSQGDPTFWIAGEDPSDCPNNDGDCNLTLVKVQSVSTRGD
jgi:hypothetical protein